jgi:hypothetical protein
MTAETNSRRHTHGLHHHAPRHERLGDEEFREHASRVSRSPSQDSVQRSMAVAENEVRP